MPYSYLERGWHKKAIDAFRRALKLDAVIFSLEYGILKDFEFMKKSIEILKEKYQELYNFKKEFFDGAMNLLERKKMRTILMINLK